MQRFNHLAVLVSVILHQMLGFFWYSPAPWAAARLQALGRPLSDLNAVDPVALGLDIVCWIVASYVIAWLVQKTGATSAARGAMLGLVLWLGLAIPTLVPHYAFAGLASIVTIIDSANILVALVITGALLAAWRTRTRE